MELVVKNRTELGKKTGALRAQGMVPAELYGQGVQNMHLTVPKKEFAKIFKAGAEHGVITIMTEDGKKHSALIKSIVRDALSQEIIAIDFHQIHLDKKIRTRIPLEFIGEAPAAKQGLVIVKVMDDIEIEALPAHIPAHIAVAMEGLTVAGSTVHISDLKPPHNVKIIAAPESVVVTVAEKAKEETVAPPPTTEAPASAETTTPKTETPAA